MSLHVSFHTCHAIAYRATSLESFHFRHQPRLRNSPAVPLPDPVQDPDWYGEVWVRYPLSQTLSRILIGPVIRERCRLRMIMSSAAQVYYEEKAQVTQEMAGSYAHLLDAWYSQLPECLKPNWIVQPSHFQLQ